MARCEFKARAKVKSMPEMRSNRVVDANGSDNVWASRRCSAEKHMELPRRVSTCPNKKKHQTRFGVEARTRVPLGRRDYRFHRFGLMYIHGFFFSRFISIARSSGASLGIQRHVPVRSRARFLLQFLILSRRRSGRSLTTYTKVFRPCILASLNMSRWSG